MRNHQVGKTRAQSGYFEDQSKDQKPSRVPGGERREQNQAGINQESSWNSVYIAMGESDHKRDKKARHTELDSDNG